MNNSGRQKLFTSVQIGPYTLSHRVVMAPLTRLRSDQPGDIPGDLMLQYYKQRASEGGLIITEATSISATNRNYLGAPGIYSEDQVAGWRRITSAVHDAGGRIFLQLWQAGRTSHADLNGGVAPIAPSVVSYEGISFTEKGWGPTTPSREIERGEITSIVDGYRRGAERALASGFDGVEMHAANGYLLDQFLQDGSNKRTDDYGGTIANRTRLLLEVADAVTSVWGNNRVSVRISPSSKHNGMGDSDPGALFDHVALKLNELRLAYLHIIEPRVAGGKDIAEGSPAVASTRLRKIYKGKMLAAGGFDAESAEAMVREDNADLVAFGRRFIANPDLPKRIEHGLELNPYHRDTFYEGRERGYVDYPFHADAR
jgi:N-ethylmaleimide reductase